MGPIGWLSRLADRGDRPDCRRAGNQNVYLGQIERLLATLNRKFVLQRRSLEFRIHVGAAVAIDGAGIAGDLRMRSRLLRRGDWQRYGLIASARQPVRDVDGTTAS